MHRLPSQSAINRLRVSALLLCMRCLLVPVAAGVIIYAIVFGDSDMAVIGISTGVLAAIASILQWMVSTRTNCPLCMTPVLAAKHCAKHHHARTFLGSHRLRVALSILFRDQFRCPYCYEPTMLVVRVRK